MALSIKIYSGKGVAAEIVSTLFHELSGHSTSLLSSREVIEGGWENDTDLFIMPGGRDIPYHLALRGVGNQRIKRFVERGGAYLGICAGAYYGCHKVDFDRGMKLEVLGERELAFFPDSAYGPAFGLGTFCYDSEAGARAALISVSAEENSFRCYYNGGCFFPRADDYPQVNVIARYLEIEGHPPAIIKIRVGSGRVVLSGVHLEVGAFPPPLSLTQDMIGRLTPYEEVRKNLFQSILADFPAIASEKAPPSFSVSSKMNG